MTVFNCRGWLKYLCAIPFRAQAGWVASRLVVLVVFASKDHRQSGDRWRLPRAPYCSARTSASCRSRGSRQPACQRRQNQRRPTILRTPRSVPCVAPCGTNAASGPVLGCFSVWLDLDLDNFYTIFHRHCETAI